jgi:3-oxoacyl-[acyl-carrier protein] reductase/meso-butanediol dehydrogenase/(S,S)-butanediol dehydrogenase/diacetyl reductase
MSKKQTVVITGGSRGLGAMITKRFYESGYRVVVISRNDTGITKEMGDEAVFISADLKDVVNINKAFNEALRWAGSINVLINNVGYSAWMPLQDIDELFWDDMINTNLKSVLFASKAAAEFMGSGDSIINISSLAGKRGSANNSVYCASKFGVNGLTQALAKELGTRGIRVNAVCPVYIRTEGLEEALNKENSPSKGAELNGFLNEIQVADTCLFLASNNAGAITGQCINVDCGVMPQ